MIFHQVRYLLQGACAKARPSLLFESLVWRFVSFFARVSGLLARGSLVSVAGRNQCTGTGWAGQATSSEVVGVVGIVVFVGVAWSLGFCFKHLLQNPGGGDFIAGLLILMFSVMALHRGVHSFFSILYCSLCFWFLSPVTWLKTVGASIKKRATSSEVAHMPLSCWVRRRRRTSAVPLQEAASQGSTQASLGQASHFRSKFIAETSPCQLH